MTKIDASSTMMFREAAEAPEAVQRQLDRNTAVMARIGKKLRQLDPRFVITVARGSSDHAACFAKYLFETRSHRFTVSAGPSIFSVYGTEMDFNGCLCLLISQSGASPDLLAAARAWECSWDAALEPIARSKDLYVLGRGLGLG